MKTLRIGPSIGVLFALSLAYAVVAPAADKKGEIRFTPGPASSYATKQTNDGLTVAAIAYASETLARTAFGKVNPNDHGVLPVLVIIQNDTGEALNLHGLQAQYIAPDRSHIDATPTEEVRYVGQVPKRPQPNMGSPIPPGLFKKKNPLDSLEIIERGFSARMLPVKEEAHGFFYFQTKPRPGAKLYLTGIAEAKSGKGFVYFEIPLDSQ